MHKNSPGIRRVACRDDVYSDSSSLRPRAHTHARTHTEIQSLGWEYTRSLGVNRFGIAGTQRSRKKTYSIPITRLIRPNPRASILRRGRQSRFPFYRGPSVRRPVNTPVLRPHSGNHSSGIRHSIFNFVPPHTKSRHSREIRAISRYSTCYPQGHFPPRICQQLVVLLFLGYEFTAASPSSSSSPVHVQGFLKTYYRRQPDRASFLPFCWPSRTSAGLQSSNHPIDLPRLAPSSHPCRSFLYTRTTTASPQWSRTFHPFRASTARLATLHFSPSSAPSNLSPFSRLVASLRRVYSAK